MVMLAETALEGVGTSSNTLEQQHDTLPLPSKGGGSSSDTAGKQHGGPPALDISVVGGTRGGGPNMAGGLSIVSGR